MSENTIMQVFELIHQVFNFLNAIATVIFFIAGLGLVLINRYTAFRLSRRKNINVSAKIIKSEMYDYLSTDSSGLTTMYRPIVEYTYEINGQNYQSDRIAYSSITSSTSDKWQIKTLIRQYPVGKVVNAFVDSKNLDDAYLIERSPGDWVFTCVGCFLILGSFLLYRFF